MADMISSQHESVLLHSWQVRELLAGQLTESSMAMYQRDIMAYKRWAENHHLLPLDAQTLAAWRDDLALHTNMSPHTINRQLAAVKRFVRCIAEKELLPADVVLPFEKLHGVKVRALRERLKQHSRTRIEQEDMRGLCDMPDTSTLVGKRDRALLLTLAKSGLRASEAASLTTEQIHKRGRGYIVEVCGKTDTEYRDAHLSIDAYTAIMEWIAARPITSDAIFTSFAGRGEERITNHAISTTAVWQIVTYYAEAYGLKHSKPHDFRRFVGTQLAAKDIRKAQLALGHKSVETTARHYVLDRLEPGETDNLF